MLKLKRYQWRCIEELTKYLRAVRKSGNPKTAFIEAKEQPYKVLHGDPNVPFVCIRVPTGGGKTLIAAHAVAVAFGHYLQEKEEVGLVLWLVPSDSIRSQTLAQLGDVHHPYREALDRAFDTKVKVMDITEARSIKPGDLAGNVCIVVATLASVRREDTEGLKVYRQNGALTEHFRGVRNGDLFKDKAGLVVQSLANVIRLHRPLIILDEGHNAQTELSVEVIGNFLPSCIVEFTATPLGGSNVLVEVPAVELKQVDMVKIPIELTNITNWQETVRAAKEKRDALEKIAEKEQKRTKEVVHPILLVQAEREQEHPEKVHVHKLVDFLTGELKVKREAIAIKTGREDELKQHRNLMDPKCSIRYIVTCNALKEGWDCAFAYVLASVSNLGTRLGVEQLIGRILRLPNAKRKEAEELNHSYVFTSSRRFDDAAQLVIVGLEQEGYHKSDIIQGSRQGGRAEYEAIRAATKEDFSLPYLGIGGEPLDFYDLLPPDFSLRGKEGSLELLAHLENSTALIDVTEDAIVTSKRVQLRRLGLSREETEEELVQWLSRHVQEQAVERRDMTAFLRGLITRLRKKRSLASLYAQKFALRDGIREIVERLVTEEAERQFRALQKTGKLTPSRENEWRFPHELTLLHPLKESFTRHLFDHCEDCNNPELELARQLDNHENVDWWLRNVVQDTDGFRLQGFQREGFYPDFIVLTKSGKWWVLEYKGEDRATNEDSEYKDALGRLWAEVCGSEFHFALVTRDTLPPLLPIIT